MTENLRCDKEIMYLIHSSKDILALGLLILKLRCLAIATHAQFLAARSHSYATSGVSCQRFLVQLNRSPTSLHGIRLPFCLHQCYWQDLESEDNSANQIAKFYNSLGHTVFDKYDHSVTKANIL